jgi:hypothetical protein
MNKQNFLAALAGLSLLVFAVIGAVAGIVGIGITTIGMEDSTQVSLSTHLITGMATTRTAATGTILVTMTTVIVVRTTDRHPLKFSKL